MAHYAKVENGIVTQVIVAEQDVIDSGLFGTGWVQTSYNTRANQHPLNTPLRKNYAGIGYTYDEERDAFIPPKPYPSWVLDEYTCLWVAPVDRPTGDTFYVWDEAVLNWVLPEDLTPVETSTQEQQTIIIPSVEDTNVDTTPTITIDLSSNGADSIMGGADSISGGV